LSGDQAVGFQQVISGGDRGTVQAKQASQFASGWEPFTAREIAGVDTKSNPFIELTVQRYFGLMVESGREIG
jgi:hypothetical protein